jgi:hypothetical protein
LLTLLTFCAGTVIGRTIVDAAPIITDLGSIPVSQVTGEKPQSKVWRYDGTWWAVLPDDSFSSASDDGTWVWKLQGDGSWTIELQLSNDTGTKADVKQVGNVVHILLYRGTSTQLVSIQYDATTGRYEPWPTRPSATPIALSSSEIATIDIDSTERMWLATESGSSAVVYCSDPPYSSFMGPFAIATGIGNDDITLVTAIPNPSRALTRSGSCGRIRPPSSSDSSTTWTGPPRPRGQPTRFPPPTPFPAGWPTTT